MKRREFLATLGAAVAWPGAGMAQPGEVARIGVLVLGNPDPAPFVKGLRDGLRDLGYIEGQNISFEFRSADGNSNKLPSLAAELIALKVDVIAAFQTPAAIAAKQATREIPIVMNSGDPIGTGLVASLARPGGNVTGVSGAGGELGAKNLELIREVLPAARRVGVLANAPDPFSRVFLRHIQDAEKTLNVEIKPFMIVRAEGELGAAFAEMAASRTDAVIVQPSLPLGLVARMAIEYRLPSFAPNSLFPEAGGLMGYSADYDTMYRDCAALVEKVLKGRKPVDLPVQMPSRFSLTVNLKTAKAIGVTVPAIMLTRADNVIE